MELIDQLPTSTYLAIENISALIELEDEAPQMWFRGGVPDVV